MTAPTYTGLARAVDGIPVVPTSAARNARYTSPPEGFRVWNNETNAIERYESGSWVARLDLVTGGASIRRFGPAGNGSVSEDTAAFQAAIASSERLILLDAATYILTAVGEVPAYMNFVGLGRGVTVLKRRTTSTVFTVKTAGVQFRELSFDADVATSTTYGTSGCMIEHPGGAFTSAEGRIINCDSANLDTVVQFGPDGGARHQVIGGYWLPYTTTVGSEGKVYRTGVGGPDTGARFRKIIGLTTDGQIDETGSVDSEWAGVSCRRPITTSTTDLLGIQGGIWGSSGQAVTIFGSNIRVMGIRMAGNITLDSTMSGSCIFVGNTQTSGTFTDNTAANVCLVLHHPLSVSYLRLGKFAVSTSVNAEEVQSSRPSTDIGNASTTLTADQSPRCIRWNTVITADRDGNLPAPATCRDGMRFRFVRQASATGAFNVNIKTSAAVTLKALGTAGTWTEVEFSASLAEFFVCGGGTI